MKSHPSRTALTAYREGNLAAHDLLFVDDHISTCPDCRESVSMDASVAARRWAEAIGGAHLSYELMERRVDGDGTPDESADVREHMEICEPCASEVADLESFARPLPRMRPWRWLALAAAAAFVAFLVVIFATRDRGEVVPPRIAVTPVAPPAQTETQTPAQTQMQTSTEPPVAAPDPLQSLDPGLRRVAEALQAGTIVSAELLASLHRAPEQQRGDTAEGVVRVTEPVGVVVENDRPTFRWTRRTAVTVQVFDRSYALVAESPRLDAASWRAQKPLRRGATYRWQLLVHGKDGDRTVPAPPAPQALFRILDEPSFRELTRARESGTKLEAGLICVREGLFDEGAQLLGQYAREHPDDDAASRLAERARAAAQSPPTATNGAQ
jgi:hypothetical protein